MAKADGLVLTRVRVRAGRPGWRSWGGSLAGSGALEEHRKEHAREAKR